MIIAEVGKNHHGSEDYAKEYLRKSIASGVDGILYHIREKDFIKKLKIEKNHYLNHFTKMR